jgi:hypothetical protein
MQTFDKSDINKISEEYKAALKENKLAIGQTVQFRLLSGVLNPDVEERRKREILWAQSVCIVGKDRIRDPFSDNLVDIAVVKSIDKEGNVVPEKLYVPARDSNGFITIVGGNVAQERWYEFLQICNENESNPHRDKNIKPKFKQIDAAKESKEQNKRDDLLTEMLVLVKSFSKAERQEVAAAYGWDRHSEDDVIIQRLREIAKKDPEGFSKIVGNKIDLSMKAVIHDAITEGVITYAPLENKFTFTKTNEVICTLTRSESVEPKDQFLEWLKTNPSGKAVLNNIKKLLKSSE